MMRKLAAAFLLLLPVSARAELPPDLSMAVKAYEEAQVRNDVSTLDRLVADDFVLVNSDTSLQNKESFLDDFRRPGFRLDPYVVESPVERVFGDAAVVGGVVRLGWTQDGKHQTRVLRLAYVWRNRGGRWQAAYAQLTRVPG